LLLLAILLGLSLGVAAPARAEPEATPIVIGQSYRLTSTVLGDEREINVWTPPSYEQGEARYAVLYVLDGALDQDFEHIAGLAQLGALSWTYEALIVVGVQTRERQHELTPAPADERFRRAFPTSGGANEFRRFLRDDVFAFVDEHYRTSPRRALIGESLAGLFVVDTFLKAPDMFSDYIAISPSLWWDDRALARDAGRLLAQQSPGERRLYLSMANEGGTMGDGMRRLTRALRTVHPAGLDWTFVDRSREETHATIYHRAALEALRHYFALAPYETGPAPWYMIEGASPPQE
jgi:hypothetical protein